MSKTTAKTIEFDETHLRILWGDGQEASYALESLRERCPCALCRRTRETEPERVKRQSVGAHLEEVSKMGFYGLKLFWRGGHNTGIYTLDALRDAFDGDGLYPLR